MFRVENILNVCEKILYFFKVNLLFLLSNLPVLLFAFFIGLGQIRAYLPLFIICSIPLGPALSAMFFVMNRVIHRLDTTAWNDYRQGYVDSWKQKFVVSAIHMVVLLVFWTNIEFFGISFPVVPLMILFIVLFAVVLLATPNLYLLTSRYEMSLRDIWKGALVITITRPLLTFGNFIIFAAMFMMIELNAGIILLFICSIYGFLVVSMNQSVFRMLEDVKKER